MVTELARLGYNAEQEAVTLLAGADVPERAVEAVVDHVDDDALRITAGDVRAALVETGSAGGGDAASAEPGSPVDADEHPSVSTGDRPQESVDAGAEAGSNDGSETGAEAASRTAGDSTPTTDSPDPAPRTDASDSPAATDSPTSTRTDDVVDAGGEGSPADAATRTADPSLRSLSVTGDVTGQSTGTGEYGDFVTVFRDRYEKLSKQLRGRVNHRPTEAIRSMNGGSDAAIVGLVNDVRSTKNGHWIVELEDTTGTFPCLVMKDREFADLVDELLLDECIAVEGTLSDDGEIVFVDAMYFPDVPRTHTPNTADRHVQAALVSDLHVGSQEFEADAWDRFASWLHSEEAARVEYLLIAGDMVEGVGVYPGQDEELDIVDIYDQYEAFAERLKDVPGDMEILMIPGNHDAVRLAEPQPGFDETLRDVMSAHDARITGNPSLATVEGVNVLMYHGVSLDEVIAELPEAKASYEEPHKAMYQLLKKRHVAPQFGGKTRLAPEEKDYLVMEAVPDVFHTGHVHKIGWGKYHNVLAVNSGCWQAQTDFQKSVNIDPDVAHAPILDLDTLDMTVRKFA
ncbi:DNA-directed DNA polymerase II small subunit [Halobellus ruber]